MSHTKHQTSNILRPTLVSGIQPTSKLHIGNYLGALKNFVDLQNSGKYECFFFIADLHALTENPDPEELKKNIIDLTATFLAVGLDSKKSTLFIQSHIPAHQELCQILSPLTPVSELMRMTAFKEKVLQTLKLKEGQIFSKQDFNEAIEESNFGLAAYPVLMTADIILYDAQFVPIGNDQLQHLELARTLVRKFNAKFGKTFREPQPLLTSVPRLMSLDNPKKKMSKSLPTGCLFIDDEPKIMKEKIMRAVTDSGKEIKYDPIKKPAVSNLIEIYATLDSRNIKHQTSYVEHLYKNKGYADFKKDLAEITIAYFAPFQKRKKELAKKPTFIKNAFTIGEKHANSIASKRILEIKSKIGLII